MNKTQQCSTWHVRPLTSEQVRTVLNTHTCAPSASPSCKYNINIISHFSTVCILLTVMNSSLLMSNLGYIRCIGRCCVVEVVRSHALKLNICPAFYWGCLSKGRYKKCVFLARYISSIFKDLWLTVEKREEIDRRFVVIFDSCWISKLIDSLVHSSIYWLV